MLLFLQRLKLYEKWQGHEKQNDAQRAIVERTELEFARCANVQ